LADPFILSPANEERADANKRLSNKADFMLMAIYLLSKLNFRGLEISMSCCIGEGGRAEGANLPNAREYILKVM
jgi:hypothetical protein